MFRARFAPTDVKFLTLFDGNLDRITKIRLLAQIRVVFEMPSSKFLHVMRAVLAGIHLSRYFSHDQSDILFQKN